MASGNGTEGRRHLDRGHLDREGAVAERIGVSVRTLRQWRWRGGGPAYRKLGAGTKAAVRYAPEDVQAWLDAATRTSTSDSGGEA